MDEMGWDWISERLNASVYIYISYRLKCTKAKNGWDRMKWDGMSTADAGADKNI